MSWEVLAALVGVGLLVLGGVVRRRFTRVPPPRPRERPRDDASGSAGPGADSDRGGR